MRENIYVVSFTHRIERASSPFGGNDTAFQNLKSYSICYFQLANSAPLTDVSHRVIKAGCVQLLGSAKKQKSMKDPEFL